MSIGWTREKQLKYPEGWKKTILAIKKANKGKHYSPATEFKEGQISTFKGKHHSEESKRKLRIARAKQVGENSPAWKGDKVGKTALHAWVAKQLGKPQFCEGCGTQDAKRYNWANKTYNYERNIEDWLRLCCKCHLKYDKESYKDSYKKAWITRRKNGNVVPWNKGLKMNKG